MISECLITLDPRDLCSFLEYLSASGFPPLITFGAVQPSPASAVPDDEPLTMYCQLAFEQGDLNENYDALLMDSNYGYANDRPLWLPAALVNLPIGGMTSHFLKDREAKGFEILSLLSAYPAKADWRLAIGFFDADSRDAAAELLAPIQEAERSRALSLAQTAFQEAAIVDRYHLSLREGYTIFTADSSLAAIVSQFDLLPLPARKMHGVGIEAGSFMWVYHANITHCDNTRLMRIFTHVSDSGNWQGRHNKSDEISRWILEENGVDYDPYYIVRMELRRDKESLLTLSDAVALLADNNIELGSLQTIVPPKMESEQSLTLYGVIPEQEQLLFANPF